MDTTKQNPLQGAQESDDLIAELARLVAQDARSTSANSAAYNPPPPPSDPEPEFESEPALEQDQIEPGFEFGSGHVESGLANDEGDDQQSVSSTAEGLYAVDTAAERDPIADLIETAERDSFDDTDVHAEERFYAAAPDVSQHGTAPAPAAEFDSEVTNPESEKYASDDFFVNFDREEPRFEARTDADRDPLREIEALIGEAARVSVGAGEPAGRRVRSSFLDTTDYQDAQATRSVDSAESAILAAAAAGGTSVRHIEDEPEPAPATEELSPVFVESDPSTDPDPARADLAQDDFEAVETEERPVRERRRTGFLVPVAAGVIILAALAGGYVLFLAPEPVPSEAPVLTADAGEIKEVPENAAEPTTASESVIFNEIDGNTVAPEDELLVSRDQTGGATGADIGRVIAPEEGEVGLANRPVRTVTVRPDGTIVSSDNSVAGSNVLPVERPDVPTVPNSTLTSDPIGEAIAAAISDDPEPAAPQTPTAVAETAAVEMEAPEAQTSATESEIVDPANIPRPIPRPSGLSSAAPAQQPQTTSTAPAQVASVPDQVSSPDATEPVSTTPSNVGAWVQLSSQRSEEAARADIPSLQSRYGSLFGGTPLDVSRVDLGDRGIYYRVRLPQQTLAAANSVCDAIRGQGGDCFVLNNN